MKGSSSSIHRILETAHNSLGYKSNQHSIQKDSSHKIDSIDLTWISLHVHCVYKLFIPISLIIELWRDQHTAFTRILVIAYNILGDQFNQHSIQSEDSIQKNDSIDLTGTSFNAA